jgi:PAS domain S-box-containing protein
LDAGYAIHSPHWQISARLPGAATRMGVRGLVERWLGFSRKNPWIPPADVMAVVLEHSADAVIVVALDDPALVLCYLNPAFEALTGYGRDEVIGKSCGFLVGDDRLQPGIATIRTAIETRAPVAVTLRNYRKDGSVFWNALRIFPVVETHDHEAYLVAVMRDVARTGPYGGFGREGGNGTGCGLPSLGKPQRTGRGESQVRNVDAPSCIDTGIISVGDCVERVQRLSPRERDVLKGLVEGCGNKEIARNLGLSPRTVELYRANLKAKLGVETLTEMLRIALTAGLFPSP